MACLLIRAFVLSACLVVVLASKPPTGLMTFSSIALYPNPDGSYLSGQDWYLLWTPCSA